MRRRCASVAVGPMSVRMLRRLRRVRVVRRARLRGREPGQGRRVHCMLVLSDLRRGRTVRRVLVFRLHRLCGSRVMGAWDRGSKTTGPAAADETYSGLEWGLCAFVVPALRASSVAARTTRPAEAAGPAKRCTPESRVCSGIASRTIDATSTKPNGTASRPVAADEPRVWQR
jgi:hypothetical protein